MVKIDDPAYAQSHGIDATPQLVYFENEVPNIFAGQLSNEDEVSSPQFTARIQISLSHDITKSILHTLGLNQMIIVT